MLNLSARVRLPDVEAALELNRARQRVVITGMGLVTPLGCGVSHVWDRLMQGESGIRPVRGFDVTAFPSRIAGQIPHEDDFFDQWVSPKDRRRMGRFIVLSMAAAAEALQDADWMPEDDDRRQRTGVLVGSGIGGLPEIEHWSLALKEGGPSRVSPFFVPSALINLASGHIAIRYGFTGPNLSVVTACSTGAHAIGEAVKMIRCGQADVVVAGAGEAAVCPIGLAGFSAMKALSSGFNDTPEQASRPWDVRRDGFVIGEGAGVVVLESLAHAQARGAPHIYAEVLGYGLSGDAYHIAAPRDDGDGAARCMLSALDDAGLHPQEVGYINAHGTSTPAGDVAELRAIARVFAPQSADSNISKAGPLVSSTKSSIGHLLGAAGSVEAIFTVLALRHGCVPGTLNLHEPEETPLNLVALQPQLAPDLRVGLSNSFGFGGTNASLIFGKI